MAFLYFTPHESDEILLNLPGLLQFGENGKRLEVCLSHPTSLNLVAPHVVDERSPIAEDLHPTLPKQRYATLKDGHYGPALHLRHDVDGVGKLDLHRRPPLWRGAPVREGGALG